MYSTKYQLDKNDMFVLKGIAILAIVLHNFCHWIPQIVIENQDAFRLENSLRLVEHIFQGGPHLILNLISHYGHYGVAVFVFLSGYGLELKYEKSHVPVNFPTYLSRHFKKLWLLLLPLLIPYFLVYSVIEPGYFQEHILDLGLMVGFVGNLNPHHFIFQGPWWFFSMIVQLYIVYYLFAYRRTLKPVVILTIICLIAQVAAYLLTTRIGYLGYLRYNFVGSMLPFALGIFAARKKVYPTILTSVVLLVLFLLSGFNIYSWVLTFGMIPFVILPVTKLVRMNKYLYSGLVWVGGISAFVFVCHPIIRDLMWKFSGEALYLSLFAYLVLSILFALIYGHLLSNWGKYYSSLKKTFIRQ